MSTGLGASTLPPTPAQVLGLIASLPIQAQRDALLALDATVRSPGVQALCATNIGQLQAAVGLRRTFSPFQY